MAKRDFVRSFVLIPAVMALIGTFLLSVPAKAQSATDNLDPVLRHRARQLTGKSRVLVEYRGAADVRAVTSVRGRAGRKLAGGRLQVADVDNISLAALANDPRVARLTIDRETFTTMERTGAAVGAQAARTDFGVTGRGIGVAVIDSGISAANDDLLYDAAGRPAPAVVHFKDFTRDETSGVWTPDLPVDDFGHGTHVAGIIRGSGYDSDGRRRGIAPGTKLIGLKVLDREGHGHISDVIEALDYAVSLKKQFNLRVINLSVGAGVLESYRFDPLTQAAKRAVDAGIVVVAAAGNLGRNSDGEIQYGGITAPGNAPWVITVGASSHQGTTQRSDDAIADFSSRGPTWIDFTAKPDLLAPGVGIEAAADPHSTLYTELANYRLDGTRETPFQPYLSLSGTSMAAPVVAGAVALMLEANPSLTPNAVKAILEFTAQKRGTESALAQGAGLLNVHGAIRMAEFFRHPATGLGRPGDTIETEWIPWSRQLVWGNYRITGGVPMPRSNAWALDVTWGSLRTATGTPVVWGARDAENIVWSTRDNENIVWSTRGNDNIVWSTRDNENIVWSTRDNENIVWSTRDNENIVWSTHDNDNIVWSTGDNENIVWSTSDSENIVWSTAGAESDNIVWSTSDNENIVWSTHDNDNIVWSTAFAQNVVWGADCDGRNCTRRIWGAESNGVIWGMASDADNIVWSTAARNADNIVWSTSDSENIVWSTSDTDNIVWSTNAPEPVLWPAPAVIDDRHKLAGLR
jgi:serine protease AprX